MGAMIIHAAGESVTTAVPDGTYAGALMVRDESHLRAEAARLEARGADCVRIVENQGPYAGQLMALGLRPGRKEVLRKLVSSLPLLR